MSLFLAYLTVTEVGQSILSNIDAFYISFLLHQQISKITNFFVSICVSGQEVAIWVKENFKKELVKLQSYKSKCYKEALEEIFLKLDELM